MFRNIYRALAGVAFIAVFLPMAFGQDNEPAEKKEPPKKKALKAVEDEYRNFFKQPENAQEFWAAMKFEINVGKYDLAAEYLKGFLDKKPTDQELLEIVEQDGISRFLRLLAIPQLRADAGPLLERVNALMQKELSDPIRIGKFIANLNAPTSEEQTYALEQLRRSGPAAVPFLIEVLRSRDRGAEHGQIINTLIHLNENAVPPMLAALEAADAPFQIALIGVLKQRRETSAIPYLWHPSSSGRVPESVRKSATEALALLHGLPEEKLPLAKVALTQEAERYYQHRVRFLNPQNVIAWKWDKDKLVAQKLSATQAEEYYGLHFAGQAIDLDPNYEPAQVVYLSLAVEKGFERSGLDQPLDKEAPKVKHLVETVNPTLVITMLDRALTDHQLPVILGATRALGDLGEIRAVQPLSDREPALLRALYYPDRRVQIAAADALLRMPGVPPYRSAARLVEVLRRAVAADPVPTALVADFDRNRADAEAKAVKQAGYATEVRTTGRQVLQRLAQAGDIDVVLIDYALPDPGLPYFLAQIRKDPDVGLLPIIVTVEPNKMGGIPDEIEQKLRYLIQPYRNVWIAPSTFNPQTMKDMLSERLSLASGRPLSEEERKANAKLAMIWLKRLAVGEIPGYDIRPATSAVVKALRVPELTKEALEAASRLPGRETQFALANVVLSSADDQIRAVAAAHLARHVQQYGIMLTLTQVQRIESLYSSLQNPKAKSGLALLLGAFHPDAAVTAERLRAFQPEFTAPAIPAPKEK